MSTAVTTGSWPAISVNSPTFSGLGTDRVSWGVPAGSGKSGYVFRGGQVDVRTDGTEFTLGTFTHENFPVTSLPQNEFDVDLRVNVAFEDGTRADFSFRFHHNETPNNGPAPEDLVDLPTFISPETVKIDGVEYKVVISGFKQNGRIVRQFVSDENSSNSADIVALFTRPGKPDVAVVLVRSSQSEEYVEILNRGTDAADMSGWVLRPEGSPHEFTFPQGTMLQPGHRIRVYTEEKNPEPGSFSYGVDVSVWNDRGGVAGLRDKDGKEVSEFRYGNKARVPAP